MSWPRDSPSPHWLGLRSTQVLTEPCRSGAQCAAGALLYQMSCSYTLSNAASRAMAALSLVSFGVRARGGGQDMGALEAANPSEVVRGQQSIIMCVNTPRCGLVRAAGAGAGPPGRGS